MFTQIFLVVADLLKEVRSLLIYLHEDFNEKFILSFFVDAIKIPEKYSPAAQGEFIYLFLFQFFSAVMLRTSS